MLVSRHMPVRCESPSSRGYRIFGAAGAVVTRCRAGQMDRANSTPPSPLPADRRGCTQRVSDTRRRVHSGENLENPANLLADQLRTGAIGDFSTFERLKFRPKVTAGARRGSDGAVLAECRLELGERFGRGLGPVSGVPHSSHRNGQKRTPEPLANSSLFSRQWCRRQSCVNNYK